MNKNFMYAGALALLIGGWMSGCTSSPQRNPVTQGLLLVDQLNVDLGNHDSREAALSLARIARQWPAYLDQVSPMIAQELDFQLHKAHQDDLDHTMLDALFNADWPSEVYGADYLWRHLALMDIRRHELARATGVALRINTPRVVLSMRVDKRFDFVRRKHPQAFDIHRALTTQIRKARAAMKAHPHQLSGIENLQRLYLQAGRYDRVLAVSNAAVKLAKLGRGDTSYTDFDTMYNWVLNVRATALQYQGHWDQAIQTLKQAAGTPEQGQPNVSQAINLGALYAAMNRPAKATEAIAQIVNTSPYGSMQLAYVKFLIAIDRHDKVAIARDMAYLRAHRKDAIGTWEDALLLRGDLNRAAALLIERLRNPDWRSDALLSLQDYPDVPRTFLDKRIDARFLLISKRPDVQAALHQVGRVEHVHLTFS